MLCSVAERSGLQSLQTPENTPTKSTDTDLVVTVGSAMPQTKPLSTKELIGRIHNVLPDYKPEKTPMLEILEKAVSLGVLTKDEISATTPRKFRVVKCYLRTIVRDKKIRRRLDAYVKCMSTLWSRSLALLNLATHQISGIPLRRKKEPDKEIIWWKRPPASQHTPAKVFYELVFAGANNACPEFLRKLVCPERWEWDSLPLQTQTTLEMFHKDVSHLYTQNWRNFPKTSLHQQETYLARTMKTNIQVMVRSACIRAAKIYVKTLQRGQAKVLYKLFTHPWPKIAFPQQVTLPVRDHIYLIRSVLGVKDSEFLPSHARQISPDLLDLYFFFYHAGLLNSNLMPLGTPGRKHFRIDEKIAKSLFAKQFQELKSLPDFTHLTPSDDVESTEFRHRPMLEFLGFSVDRFSAIQNNKRRRLRRRAKAQWQDKQGKKVLFCSCEVDSQSNILCR